MSERTTSIQFAAAEAPPAVIHPVIRPPRSVGATRDSRIVLPCAASVFGRGSPVFAIRTSETGGVSTFGSNPHRASFGLRISAFDNGSGLMVRRSSQRPLFEPAACFRRVSVSQTAPTCFLFNVEADLDGDDGGGCPGEDADPPGSVEMRRRLRRKAYRMAEPAPQRRFGLAVDGLKPYVPRPNMGSHVQPPKETGKVTWRRVSLSARSRM